MKGRIIDLQRTPSDSTPGKSYETILWAIGGELRSSCNCRGWTFKKKGQDRGCAHTRRYFPGKPPALQTARSQKLRPATPMLRPVATFSIVPDDNGLPMMAPTRLEVGMDVELFPVEPKRRRFTPMADDEE